MTTRGPVTLLDVAQHAGVSLATASRVINGSQRRVSAGLRERVMAAAEELRYVRNAYAQALARSRTSIAGIIVYDIGHPYFAGIIRGVQRVAFEAGQIVLVCNSDRDRDREMDYLTLLHEHRAATIIVAASGDGSVYTQRVQARLESFIEGGGRVATIGRFNPGIPAVIPDNEGGMHALGRELTRLGHRRLAVISGPRELFVTQDRLRGLRAALTEADIDLPEDAIIPGTFHRQSGKAAVETMFDRGIDPTAIVACNDEMAVGALISLRRRGLRVPQDVSVAGFDDIAVAADFQPSLTTVRLPLEELGERAMRIALRDDPADVSDDPVPTELVVRESTAPPRARNAALA